MIPMRVLVIEDDKRIASVLVKGLKAEAYAVDVAYDGESGEEGEDGESQDGESGKQSRIWSIALSPADQVLKSPASSTFESAGRLDTFSRTCLISVFLVCQFEGCK